MRLGKFLPLIPEFFFGTKSCKRFKLVRHMENPRTIPDFLFCGFFFFVLEVLFAFAVLGLELRALHKAFTNWATSPACEDFVPGIPTCTICYPADRENPVVTSVFGPDFCFLQVFLDSLSIVYACASWLAEPSFILLMLTLDLLLKRKGHWYIINVCVTLCAMALEVKCRELWLHGG